MIVDDQNLTPGVWYLLATCEYCHTKHVIEVDSTKGGKLPKAIYSSRCPGCLRIGLYAAGEIERYQHDAKINT